jgi:hypothetical protein
MQPPQPEGYGQYGQQQPAQDGYAGYGGYGEYGAQPLPQQMPMPQALPPQGLPPQAPVMGASDATQFIAPITGAGPLPPEAPAESTQYLGVQPGAAPMPMPMPSDAEPTQFLPPVPSAPSSAPFDGRPGAPGERPPPAEFDSLFRTEGAPAQAPPDATAQLPRFEPPVGGRQQRRQSAPPPPQQQYQQPPQHQQQYQQPAYQQPQYGQQPPEPQPERRRSSRTPVIAALVVGCAVLGLGVSAVMFKGDDKKNDTGTGENVAATSAAPSGAPKAADPTKAQAVSLDKLLADSNNSRAAVIRSVENIKQCKNLDQAATDLTGAAEQRRGLVTRLEALSIDKLPDNAALSTALTKAWQASASADDHYAAWAVQVKGEKGCKGGKARSTGRTVEATRASGDATKAKKEASGLWNKIASEYGLTERRSEQL